MKISCPSCSAKYSISDEKVVSRLAKIRCRKCGATIVIDGKVNPPQVTTSATADATETPDPMEASGTEYSVDLGEGDQRTMAIADIVTAYNAGQITGETYVWADGFADWKPLADVEEIMDAINAGKSAPRGSAPKAASPWDGGASASAARAAARPARGGSSDLFGRIERAGSEDEVATSAPDASGGSSGATGSRNESSVLFSLSALTSASKPSATGTRSSVAAASSASREDSGLIDLKALTAAAVRADPGSGGGMGAPAIAPLATAPLGVAAPLGLGSPIAVGGLSADSPAKSKTGLFLAIAIVAAAVIVALAVILKPTPPPVVVAPPPPAPAPAPAPTPTPTPTLAALPPPTGSGTAEEAPSTDKKKPVPTTSHHSGGGTKKSTGSSTSSPPAGGGDSTPAAPAKPKGNKCGCAPADLVCNMRCSAKG